MMETFDYIACRPDMPWEWDEKEDYLVLKNGGTIAHWNEVKQIVAVIADQGLPLFDVLVLLLAASGSLEFTSPAQLISEHFSQLDIHRNGDEDQLDVLFVLQNLSSEYKSGEQRLLMLTTVLQKSHVKLRLKTSKQIAKNLLADTENETYVDKTANKSVKHTSRVLNCLRILGNHFPDEKSIVTAMAEYDFEKIQELDFDLLGTEDNTKKSAPIDLEEELLQDARTQKLAQLIPHVLAGMNFPLIAKKSDDRPEGGVSDLSNKGHFDQLVITEYAYDDDLFISRIVNNEALFFQREKAKNDHDENYCVLIDASLFAWGEPKFIACAMACCVGLKNPDATVTTYMVGNGLHTVNLRKKDGVILALKIAEASLNPTKGLHEFIAQETDYSSVMLISTQKSLNQPEMMELRNVHGTKFDFITTVSEEAEVKINRLKGKVSASFQLNLTEIWSEKSQTQEVPEKEFYYPEEFPPVRVPINADKIYRSMIHDGTLYMVMRNRHLVQTEWKGGGTYNRNAGILLGRLNHMFDYISDVAINSKGEKELLLFSLNSRMIHVQNLNTSEYFVYHFAKWKNARNRGGNFVHDGRSFIYTFDEGYYRFDHTFVPRAPWRSDQSFEDARAIELRGEKKGIETVENWSYFKNIKRCSIDRNKVLYLHNWRLIPSEVLGDREYIAFEPVHHVPLDVVANRRREGKDSIFTFLNDAKIRVNRFGVIKFSFPQGVKLKGYKIVLTSTGSKPLEVIKAIRSHSNLDLAKSKEFILQQKPRTVCYANNLQRAKEIHGDLSYAGAEAEIRTISLKRDFYMVPLTDYPPVFASEQFFSGRTEFLLDKMKNQQQINQVDFYNLYFQPFIEGILDYEA